MKVLIIDNYDSFTFNLVQLVGKFTDDIIVKRNDKISLDEINEIKPDKIMISPGPGVPKDSGISLDIIRSTRCTAQWKGYLQRDQTKFRCRQISLINT